MKKLGTMIAKIIVITTVLFMGAANAQDFPKPTFDAEGKLNRPDTSYREWVYVGTPLTPNELNPPEAPFPEFHNVYIHPDSTNCDVVAMK